jgi:hypothetical protein
MYASSSCENFDLAKTALSPDAKNVISTPAMTAERAFLKKSLFIRYTSHYKFIAHIDGAQSPPSFYR